MTTRIFLMGVVILFFGIQLRSFETFVLNEQVSSVINRRAAKQETPAPLESSFLSYGEEQPKPVVLPTKRQISPPRWLGYSFLSIGAVLVLSCPLCRT